MALITLSEKQKNILYVVGAFLCIIFLGYLIYIIFFKAEPADEGYVNINGELINISELPNANENVNREVVVNENVNQPTLPSISTVARGGNTLVTEITAAPTIGASTIGDFTYYYDPLTGKFYRITASGERIELGDGVTYKGALSVVWSPDGSQALIEFLDGSNILYDFQSKTQATLPKEIEEVEFSAKGEQIGFEYVTGNPDTSFIGVSKPNGSEIRNVQMLGDKEASVDIEWSPTSEVVATFRENSSGTTQNVFFVGLEQENFKALKVEGRGFDGQWTEDGEQMIYSVYSGVTNHNPTLWIANARGDATGTGKVNTGLATWADKCAVTGDSAYCAVPTSLPKGSGMARELSYDVPDNFWKINLNTGSKTLIANPVLEDGSGSFSADRVMVSSSEDRLYFTDSNSGRLHSINIK